MFDIGFGELALIAVLALIIAGPERLPGIMRTLGRLAGRARAVAGALRTELEREVQAAEDAEHNRRVQEREDKDGGGKHD